jgi:GT2 family glycosyltransferase
MSQISVSIIITCHNLHDFLPECIESVKTQTMSPSEIIVIHDGCSPAPVYSGTTTVFRDKNIGVSMTVTKS